MLVGLRATGAECAYAASCVVSEDGELMGIAARPSTGTPASPGTMWT